MHRAIATAGKQLVDVDSVAQGQAFRPLTEAESSELERLLDGRRVIFTDDLGLELLFRRDQAGWFRRISDSKRMVPMDDGVVDSLAPSGRWAA